MSASWRLLVAVVSLTAACSSRTSVLVNIDAPAAISSLSAAVSVDGKSATRQWSMPQLPAELVLELADVSADVELTMSAVAVTGDALTQRGSVRSVPHRQVTVDMVLAASTGGDGGGPNGDLSTVGASDLASGAADLGNADLATATIALRSASSNSVLNMSPLSIAPPAGTSPLDVLVAAIYLGYGTAGSLPTITPPAGWMLVDRVDFSTTGSLLVYWHVVGASEPASYAWASSGGQNTSGVGWIGAYTGVNFINPINAHAGSSSGVASTTCTTPSLMTTAAHTMLVASFAGYLSSGTTTWSAPPGTTLVATLNNGDNRSGLGSYVPQAASGPTGTFTATASQTQTFCLSHLLALNPN